jgi:small-conductance mechanosensitive channel
MSAIRRYAAHIGIEIPANPDIMAVAVALGLAVTAWVIAFLIGTRGGPPLARLWERHLGERGEGISARMCSLARNLTATIILALILRIYPWPPGAAFILGLALAAAAAMLIGELVRGLHFPPWVSGLLSSIAFIAILAESVGGLAPIKAVLDGVGLNAGHHRISLLTVLQMGIGLLVLYVLVRLANRIVGQTVKHTTGLDPTQQLLVQKLAGVALVIVAFFVAVEMVGIDLTALAVFSGGLGLAVGFGLQKTIGNLFAGIILLMDRSIKPGDVIVVGDSFGSVNKIGVRAVSIITRDGKEHLIPNEDLMTREVENWSYSNRNVRLHIPVGVSYDCDIALAQRLMIEAASECDRIMKVPKPNVWLRQFGDSSVDHDILVWVSDPEAGVGNVQSEILNRLWVLFKENGISIPFPQRDIHVKEWPRQLSTGGSSDA